MTAPSSGLTSPKPSITCPKCGERELTEFRAVEDSTVTYCIGVEPGVLVVDASSYNDDAGDSGSLRLECMKCLAQFPVPPGLAVDYRYGLEDES
jgi:hypothetical protein